MHRCLTVSVPLLRVWVHCPRVPEQFVTSPLCLVGYVRWDERSDPPSRQSFEQLQVTTRQSSSAALQVALRQALELNPDEPHSQFFLGRALGQKGDLGAAREQFQQAVEKSPKDPETHQSLAYALEQLKARPAPSTSSRSRWNFSPIPRA